jgi:hypothetical protein
MGADLSALDIMVVQIDGIHISEHLVLVAALGIDSAGFKHPWRLRLPGRQPLMRAADNATKCREAADFDTPLPAGAGTSPSGSRTARRNFRVETLISIRFIAHSPNQSSATARSQLGSVSSRPPRSRTRGRSTATFPAWKPILPWVRPQR